MGKEQLPLTKFLIYTRPPGSSVINNLPANAGDAGSIPEYTHTLSTEHFLPLLPLPITTKLSFYNRLSH